VSPSRSTTASQVFTFNYTDTNGVSDFGVVDVLINTGLNGHNACYVAFVPASNAVLLVDDAGDAGGPYGTLVLPTASTTSNSQCTINGTGSSVTKIGNALTLTLSISFKPAFKGNRIIFMAASSQQPQNTGWQSMGSVTVP
jgi:hypothetical protein